MFTNVYEVIMNDFESYPKRLRSVLDSKGILINEFAKAIGVTRLTASRYITGERHPDIETGIRICDYLEVPFDWLFGVKTIEKMDKETEYVSELMGLYRAANSDDRRVIEAVLSKYRDESEES